MQVFHLQVAAALAGPPILRYGMGRRAPGVGSGFEDGRHRLPLLPRAEEHAPVAGRHRGRPGRVAPHSWAAPAHRRRAVAGGGTVVIDFSSPNIAKPMHLGLLRSTVIGNSLVRIYQHQGWRAVGINHLSDWGTQFGKLMVACFRWGDHRAG